jgi:phosphoribosylanthranilate isomerase
LDWQEIAKGLHGLPAERMILAGGLKPDNVAQALKQSGLCAVDVSSGVELSPGIKDARLIHAFVSRAREAFAD